MREIRVHFDNGDHIDTRINGSIDTIVHHYLGNKFPFANESGRETMETARCIEFLDDIRVPWNDHFQATVNRVYTLSPSYMKRHALFSPIRVEFTTHYPTGTAMLQRCSYQPGMFDPW